MSIIFDPTILLYAVVEYLRSTKHLYDPVNDKPERDGQYRLVCLAPNADDAARLAHLLRAMDNGTCWYSVCVADLAEADGPSLPLVESDAQTS